MASEYVVPAPDLMSIPVIGQAGRFPVRRIYCVGRNYEDHSKELVFSGREAPFFFMKPADAIVVVEDGETGTIAYPTLTRNLHHEIELVAAIGTGGRDIAAADAGQTGMTGHRALPCPGAAAGCVLVTQHDRPNTVRRPPCRRHHR